MTNITVTVDPDQMDQWIVESLCQSYYDARVYWHNEPDNERLCDALLTVIEHHMSHDAFEKWYETIKEL
jgi:hypothetical protein